MLIYIYICIYIIQQYWRPFPRPFYIPYCIYYYIPFSFRLLFLCKFLFYLFYNFFSFLFHLPFLNKNLVSLSFSNVLPDHPAKSAEWNRCVFNGPRTNASIMSVPNARAHDRVLSRYCRVCAVSRVYLTIWMWARGAQSPLQNHNDDENILPHRLCIFYMLYMCL